MRNEKKNINTNRHQRSLEAQRNGPFYISKLLHDFLCRKLKRATRTMTNKSKTCRSLRHFAMDLMDISILPGHLRWHSDVKPCALSYTASLTHPLTMYVMLQCPYLHVNPSVKMTHNVVVVSITINLDRMDIPHESSIIHHFNIIINI